MNIVYKHNCFYLQKYSSMTVSKAQYIKTLQFECNIHNYERVKADQYSKLDYGRLNAVFYNISEILWQSVLIFL